MNSPLTGSRPGTRSLRRRRATGGDWYADYGGYVAIGCNTKTVKVCPTSFKQMLTPGMGYKIGINNNPTEAGAAFAAVFAAALASGGSFDNIKPGVDYFQKLNKAGNFVATVAGPSTVQSGATNIVLWWDYLQASEVNTLPGFAKTWKVVVPTGHRCLRGVLRPGDQQAGSEPPLRGCGRSSSTRQRDGTSGSRVQHADRVRLRFLRVCNCIVPRAL